MVRCSRSTIPLVWGLGLGPGMVDVLHCQIELVLVAVGRPTVLGAAIGEDPEQRNLVPLEEGHHPVVQQIGRGEWGLGVAELGEGDLAVGVHEGLLVNPAHALERADVKGVLGSAAAGWQSSSEIPLGVGV